MSMSENRVTEEPNTVLKNLSHTRGYVLQCHLNILHLTGKHSYTQFPRYQCNFLTLNTFVPTLPVFVPNPKRCKIYEEGK